MNTQPKFSIGQRVIAFFDNTSAKGQVVDTEQNEDGHWHYRLVLENSATPLWFFEGELEAA